jgi:hypothetical protein
MKVSFRMVGRIMLGCSGKKKGGLIVGGLRSDRGRSICPSGQAELPVGAAERGGRDHSVACPPLRPEEDHQDA